MHYPSPALAEFRMSQYMKLVKVLAHFHKDEEGVTAMEYALIASLVAIFIVVAVTAVGANLNILFTQVSSALANA
jgi:pilus assembly protein Flp/PilA